MIFLNSYSRDLYRQQLARKEHSEKITNGAEKSAKDAETGYRNNVDRLEMLSRLYRQGLSPEREIISEHFIEPTADGREGK